jgi:hypothetical protein
MDWCITLAVMMLPELGCTTTRTANCPPMVAPELATTAPCPGLVEGYHRAYILTEAEALVLASRVPLRTANAERALRTPRLSSKTRLFIFSAPFTRGRSLLTSDSIFAEMSTVLRGCSENLPDAIRREKLQLNDALHI